MILLKYWARHSLDISSAPNPLVTPSHIEKKARIFTKILQGPMQSAPLPPSIPVSQPFPSLSLCSSSTGPSCRFLNIQVHSCLRAFAFANTLPGILLLVIPAWLNPLLSSGLAEIYPDSNQFSPSLSPPLWSKPSPALAWITRQSRFRITNHHQPHHCAPPAIFFFTAFSTLNIPYILLLYFSSDSSHLNVSPTRAGIFPCFGHYFVCNV